MKIWVFTSIALVMLVGSLCPAYAAEDAAALDEGLVIPMCRYINPSETHQMDVSVDEEITMASFLMDWRNVTSDLEMVLITPSGARINSTVGEPITFDKNGSSIYYIVPDPQPGQWIAEIAAKNAPVGGEEYCAYSFLDTEGTATVYSSSDSDDEGLIPVECENCNTE